MYYIQDIVNTIRANALEYSIFSQDFSRTSILDLFSKVKISYLIYY